MKDLQPTSDSIGKTKSVPTKIRNKTRMSAFTTSIQHITGRPSHCIQTRKRNKCHPNWKGGRKTVMFADDMIVYIENPIDSTKKLLGLISAFGKTVGYKLNIKKSNAFYTPTMKYQNQKSGKKSHFL